MARARPSARVLSKNTVSPSAIATTIESASSAHASAEPSAARAPSVVSEITGERTGQRRAGTSSRLDNSGIARRRSYTVKILIAAALAPRFTVLLLDQRYFGASGGRATTIGFRERGDLRHAIDFLAARGFGEVGVFGLSLGGAVALLAAAEDDRIRAVAAYAPFADLRSLGYELYGWLGVLKYPFVALLRGWSLLFFGHDITAVSPERAAAGLSIPVLLVASRTDEQIPFAHAERLRRALARNPRAELVALDRGRHGELPAGFEARLAEFFLLYVR